MPAGLDAAIEQFAEDLVAAMDAGADGDKSAVAEGLAAAIKKFVKEAKITTQCGAGAGTGTIT